MSYCLNPACPNPENSNTVDQCAACGTNLLMRDRYRVLQALGQGGFGATFVAKDESLPGSPYCVIKQLRPVTTSYHVLQMARDLFQREAKTLGKIGNHPQIPRLLDYFEVNREFYLVQEYVSGSTLQQEVKRSGAFNESGIKQFLSEILPLMQYVHSQQVIHRDLKPANIIRRSQDKKLVLIDFGAVKDQVSPVLSTASEQTALTAYAIGTPGYAPPEQMAMRPVYASDIYALGVTCLYLLTTKSPKDMAYDPASGELVWRDLVHISDHLAEVLKKMLEVSVRHRYQNATEVLRALELEPYMDSLAKGMANQAGRTPRHNTHSTIDRNDSTSSASSSPSARMAAAIRARHAKSHSEATSLQTGVSRHPVMQQAIAAIPSSERTDEQTTSKTSTKIPNLTAAALLEAYAKGKRDFNSHDLSLLNLAKTDLSGANFHQAKLYKINLQGANLFNADFGRASLSQASVKNANLSRAYLSHADLEGADLRGADLSYSYLSNANLRGANLCGADLTGAKVSAEQLTLARTNWATVHPNGKRGLW
ncbi:MAG: pentapeptide repeat-containing protein [Timaviella obliquedivisa GSE-PSE-MK23-08B]|jgi:serine/threonine-protein kinase|nr:pentapeptide repeat-containing protein [Timaviella obliquedivisa GSE-PSE-MK23-08B]